MKSHLIIGSRGSKLALWQAQWVRSQLLALYPQTDVHIEIIKTTGDVMKTEPLKIIGGKGVFTKELEEALLDERIDVAVHSLKDLPTMVTEGLHIAAITEREDPRDALVLRHDGPIIENPSIVNLREGAIVGTSSPRRLAQLKHLRPDLSIRELRGNVDTRLRKLDAGAYDAVILAAAGLRRLGFESRISAAISPLEMLPAVGQGALGIETRAFDAETIELLSTLDHPATRAACTAERAMLRALGGGCQLPIAGHANTHAGQLRLEGLVAGLNAGVIIREAIEGESSSAQNMGHALGTRLLQRGAESLLEMKLMQGD
ncbi:MAG TPA: hydroxymethylbilane synthase [Pyrinomonadaceae bacterium]|jgi:hydroxymethylbilane synthase|nr:hydroxymethylbilane synthase [Pyrinomonadaceae bacterium]